MKPSLPRLSRRTFLKAAGVAVALPSLEAMRQPAHAQSAAGATPKRMVLICTNLGLHGPNLFPETAGADYRSTPYLDLLKEHRDDFTLFSGLSHPDQAGADGHASEMTWLTAARNPGLGGFRNSISVDQFAAEKLGYVTRFPSLSLSTAGWNSQSYTRNGVMVPAASKPSQLFAKMFLTGDAESVAKQQQQLNDGRSILDALTLQSKQLKRRISTADGRRLDDYFDSIRVAEQQLAKAGEWLDKPKPTVDVEPPVDIEDESDIIGRSRLLLDLVPLAVQTDSTRLVTMLINGRGDVPPVEGVDIGHHNLSHHGQDEKKLSQLERVETELMKTYSGLIGKLKEKQEGGGNLLDNTMVVFGSNLGNANAHDWKNLPILLAGGDFQHGRHVQFDRENNTPLCNLFVTMLQRMGVEADQFASSTGTLTW
jgi:hypothetical protein